MAIKKMYSLLDHKAQLFLLPLSFTSDGDAIRWFTTTVNAEDKQQLPSLYPEQFTLFRMADYDDQVGTFKPRDNEKETTANLPKELITGIAVLDDENKRYTIKQMIIAIEEHMAQQNVTNIKEAK